MALVRLRVGLGDLLCSEPAVRLLRTQRPDVAVSLITWPEMAPVVARLHPDVELLPFPGADGIPERTPDPAAWPGFAAAAHERGFDLAVQCYGDNPAANTVAASLGARLVGGFAPTGWTPPAGTEGLHLRYPTGEHELRRHLLLLRHLGLGPAAAEDERIRFPVTAAEEADHAARLREHGLVPGRYVVLHPGASAVTRQWPVASYAEVARRLHRDGVPVVVTGTPPEAALGRELAALAGVPVLDLVGATDLAGVALLLRDATALVGNDTGTAHLAAAVDGRAVTIFQPGDPRRWAHVRRGSRALVADVPCAPCPHLECPIDFRCSRATTPDDVLRALDEVAA